MPKLKILNKPNTNYPFDIITYTEKESNKVPPYLEVSIQRNISKGFSILPITPDNFNDIKPFHAGFKHMKEITMPKFMSLYKTNPSLKGVFIAEGDLYINEDWNFDTFRSEGYKLPTWLGYKKILSNGSQGKYYCGNFLIYIPRDFIEELNTHFTNQKKYVYSDRFFTKLVECGWLKLNNKSVADEIEHYSNIINKIRKSKCPIKM